MSIPADVEIHQHVRGKRSRVADCDVIVSWRQARESPGSPTRTTGV